MTHIIRIFVFVYIVGFGSFLLKANPIVIEYPMVVEKSIEYCVINKICIDDNHTEIFFYYKNPSSKGWINFSRTTTLEILRSSESYELQYAKGIPLSPYKHSFKILTISSFDKRRYPVVKYPSSFASFVAISSKSLPSIPSSLKLLANPNSL